MTKGMALQVPEGLYDEIDTIADTQYDGNQNEAVQALVTKGLEHDRVVREWEQSSLWHRLKSAITGTLAIDPTADG